MTYEGRASYDRSSRKVAQYSTNQKTVSLYFNSNHFFNLSRSSKRVTRWSISQNIFNVFRFADVLNVFLRQQPCQIESPISSPV